MIKNALGNLESLKNSQQFESSATSVHIIWEDLLMAFNKLLICFCPLFHLSQIWKTRIKISTGWWSGSKKYFCFLFINKKQVASCALLQRHAEFNRFYKGIFWQVIPGRIIVPWDKVEPHLMRWTQQQTDVKK